MHEIEIRKRKNAKKYAFSSKNLLVQLAALTSVLKRGKKHFKTIGKRLFSYKIQKLILC